MRRPYVVLSLLLLISLLGSFVVASIVVTETPSDWELRDAQSHSLSPRQLYKTYAMCSAAAAITPGSYRCTTGVAIEVVGVCDTPAPELPQDGTRTLWGVQDAKDDSVWHLFETVYVAAPYPTCWQLGAGEIFVPPVMIAHGFVPPLEPGALGP